LGETVARSAPSRSRLAPASTVVVLLVVVGLVAYALNSPGFAQHRAELNDGGVWISKSGNEGSFGRINKPISQLDAGLYAEGHAPLTLDVVQDGAAVVGFDQGTGALEPIDITTGRLATKTFSHVQSGSQVLMAGGTLAALEPSSGKLWAMPADTGDGISDTSPIDGAAKGLQPVGRQATMAIASDGTVLVASAATGKLGSYRRTPQGFAAPTVSSLGAGVDAGLQLTTVGTTPVAYDEGTHLLFVPGGHRLDLPSSVTGGVLQRSGPAASVVVLATPTQLLSVPLDGSRSRSLFDGGNNSKAVAPAVLEDGCVHAAWAGGQGLEALSCGGRKADGVPLTDGKGNAVQLSSNVAFRVNHGYAVINDLDTGNAWTGDTPKQVADWQSVLPPPAPDRQGAKGQGSSDAGHPQPPQANPDDLGARPGRTAVLHVLDNDSNPAGGNLAVFAIPRLPTAGATAQISPDGQTIRLTMPPDASAPVQLGYTIRSDKGLVSTAATVTVTPHLAGQNEPPHLRRLFTQRAFTMATQGVLTIPVLGDWRDDDGDPVNLLGAGVANGNEARSSDTALDGTALATPDGQVQYKAPARGGHINLRYSVGDGIGVPTTQTVPVTVLPPNSRSSAPPIAQPDVVLATAGRPVTVYPLANDLPGADPSTPGAVLRLAARVSQPSGTTVTTDVRLGAVTVIPHRAGTYLLPYTVSFGVQVAPGVIRVDAHAGGANLPPVAMPDTLTVHGTYAAVADVLANDYDPAGEVLVVQRAVPTSANPPLQVAIIGGRYLSVSSGSDVTPSGTSVVRYDVTNGKQSASGELTVTFAGVTGDDLPQPVDDVADVRAGDTVSVPVLDNDADPEGAPLALDASQLQVLDGGGSAAVAGRSVRYVAPTDVTHDRTAHISYAVRAGSGQQTNLARITVHIHALVQDPAKDAPPTPATITASAVSGSRVTINVPTYGVDPDGDSVTVAGLVPGPANGELPSKGRILAITATTISYEAFPTSIGTDSFGYRVVDRYGRTGVAQVAIGVVPPGDPQPPVAINDVVQASPGVQVRIFPLSNDLTAPGDDVTISQFTPTSKGFSREGEQVTLDKAPAEGQPATAQYRLTGSAGDATSQGQIEVVGRKGYNNPPVARDDTAKAGAVGSTATIKVLGNDYDPDGPNDKLRVTAVAAPATTDGTTVTVKRAATPQTLWYSLSDGSGAAIGIIRVPAAGAGLPYVNPAAPPIKVGDSPVTVKIRDYVIDPAGKSVTLTERDRVEVAPGVGLARTVPSTQTVTLKRLNGFNGPGSLTFEVTDGATPDSAGAHTTYITLPVQIGSAIPVLRCPASATVQLVEGSSKTTSRDVLALCHVWVPQGVDPASVRFTREWSSDLGSVDASFDHGQLRLKAASSAKPSRGQLTLNVAGAPKQTTGNTIIVTVVAPRPPTIAAINLPSVQHDQKKTVDVTSFMSSDLDSPTYRVLSLVQLTGPKAAIETPSGSSFAFAPSHDAHGIMTFAITVTDVPGRKDRQVTGTVTVNVLGLPARPTGVLANRDPDGDTADISWAPLAFTGGAPVTFTIVSTPGTGQQTCAGNGCRVHNLVYGQTYTFTVTAHNVTGPSPESADSPPFHFEKAPPTPAAPLVTARTDHSMTITWVDPPGNNGHTYNKITGWSVLQTVVSGAGAGTTTSYDNLSASTHAKVVTGLTNDSSYQFQVQASSSNAAARTVLLSGYSEKSPEDYPQGPSMAPTDKPTVTGTAHAGNNAIDAVVTWAAADPNGKPGVTYDVYQTKVGQAEASSPVCAAVSTTQCTVQDLATDGSKYTYRVAATNGTGVQSTGRSPSSDPFQASATPDAVTIDSLQPTNNDGELTITFTAGKSHGDQSTVSCTYGGGSPCGTFTEPVSGGSDSKTISGLPQGTSVQITLKDCNGAVDASVRCGPQSSQAQTTYGPPDQPINGNCSGSGTNTITYTWAAPNGRAGQRTITGFQVSVDGGGYFSQGSPYSRSVPSDGATHTIYVKSVDANGETSSGALAIGGCADAPPPPVPTVTVTKGAGCGHGGGRTECAGYDPANSSTWCTNSSCAYIHVQTANFPGSVSCSFNSQHGSGGFVSGTWGANQSKDSFNWYGYPGEWVSVTCGGKTGSMTWY
jgi:hypothetical protein